MFTRARYWTISRAIWIQSTPFAPISIRSIINLSSHLLLGLQINFFSSRFPTNILYVYRICPMRAICLANFIIVQVIKLLITQYPAAFCYSLHLRSKYSTQHLALKQPQLILHLHIILRHTGALQWRTHCFHIRSLQLTNLEVRLFQIKSKDTSKIVPVLN